MGPLSPARPLPPHLRVQVGLHRQELHQALLDEAQEEADVAVPHVGLDPQEVVNDGAVALGPGEELLDTWGAGQAVTGPQPTGGQRSPSLESAHTETGSEV